MILLKNLQREVSVLLKTFNIIMMSEPRHYPLVNTN